MKNTKSKTLWGVFFLGLGLMWIGKSFGIIPHGAYSGLFISFILILSGISIIRKGYRGEDEADKAIEDNLEKNSYQERKSYSEEDCTADTSKSSNSYNEEMKADHASSGKKNYTSIFASHNIQCTEEFTGAEITAMAGSVELDLRNAVITRDIVIDVNCFLGGIDIFLPSGVEVSISCVPIMGGVESKINGTFNRKENKATVYIRGTCFMGGIEIR